MAGAPIRLRISLIFMPGPPCARCAIPARPAAPRVSQCRRRYPGGHRIQRSGDEQKSLISLSVSLTLRSVHHGGQSRMTGKPGPNDRAKMTGKSGPNVTQGDMSGLKQNPVTVPSMPASGKGASSLRDACVNREWLRAGNPAGERQFTGTPDADTFSICGRKFLYLRAGIVLAQQGSQERRRPDPVRPFEQPDEQARADPQLYLSCSPGSRGSRRRGSGRASGT